MKIILLLFLTSTLFCTAQLDTNSYDFKFYRNGNISKTKRLNVYAINGIDSIKCNIKDNKISIPNILSVGSILIKFRNKTYEIDDIDFSKFINNGLVFIGIENDMKNFTQPLPKQPEFYMLKNHAIILKLDDYESIKKICFLSFNFTTSQEDNKATNASYTKFKIL